MAMRLSGEEPRLDAETAEHVTFTITDGHVLVPCRVEGAALHARFGPPGGNLMAIFAAHRDAVVEAAIRKHAGGGPVTVTGADLAG